MGTMSKIRSDLLAVVQVMKRPQTHNLLSSSDVYELGQKKQDRMLKLSLQKFTELHRENRERKNENNTIQERGRNEKVKLYRHENLGQKR